MRDFSLLLGKRHPSTKVQVLEKGRSRAAGLPTYQFLRSSTSARAARGCERSSRTVTGIEMLAGRPCVCITCCGGVRYVSLRHGIALCVSECENTGSVTSVRVFRPSFRTHAPTSIVRSTDGPLVSMSVTKVEFPGQTHRPTDPTEFPGHTHRPTDVGYTS